VKNVGDLEIGAIHEHQISANNHVHIIRRRWREHDFKFVRARVHLHSQIRCQRSTYDQLSFQSRRQVIAFGKSGRKMRIVNAVPAAGGVPIMIIVAVVIVAPAISVFVTVSVFAAVAMPAVSVIVAIVAVVLIVTATVILGKRDCGAERHRQDCSGPGSKP
jgi:hypothetical protein